MRHGLIFDLDGTLVDSLQGIASSLNRALAAYGLPGHPLPVIRGFIGNGARILVERAAAGADGPLLDSLEQAFKDDYNRAWPEGTIPYDGIPELLEILAARGHALAVLSNKPHPFTRTIVSRVFPSIRFDSVLGQRDGIPHKPDPLGALEISGALDISPADCIVIGDSTMDLETARNAGMRAVAVGWGYHDANRLLSAGADRVAADPSELAALLAV